MTAANTLRSHWSPSLTHLRPVGTYLYFTCIRSICRRILAHVNAVSEYFVAELESVCAEHPRQLSDVNNFGCIFTVGIQDHGLARSLYASLFKNGVMCHSVAEIDPAGVKFLPPIVISETEVDEVVTALRRSIKELTA